MHTARVGNLLRTARGLLREMRSNDDFEAVEDEREDRTQDMEEVVWTWEREARRPRRTKRDKGK